MVKRILALLLMVAALSCLVACGSAAQQPATEQPAEEPSAEESAAAGPIVYGEPWITSVVDGMVTADMEKPSERDDFFLSANFEYLRDTKIPEGQPAAGYRVDMLDVVEEQVKTLLTDESIPGEDAAMVRELYQMVLDWDSRKDGKAFLMERLQPVLDIRTLDDLSAYLASEESATVGQTLVSIGLLSHLKDPSRWMLSMSPMNMMLGSSEEYLEEDPGPQPWRDYQEGVARCVLCYAGLSDDEIQEQLDLCFAYEKAIAGSMMTREELGAYRRFELERARRQSYGAPESEFWLHPAFAPTAQYEPFSNTITISAGYLLDPFYREDMSREEMLGCIGYTIGHEISHAFDSNGSQFDASGAFNNWWTEEDRAAFDERSKKLIEYYDGLHPWRDGSPCSGIVLQGEAAADLGSLACILRIAARDPDFDYDAFFRAYARNRVVKYNEQLMENFLFYDVHPLDHLRVNVVFAQFDEFQQTYGVVPGDGMYIAPENRIGIWGMG